MLYEKLGNLGAEPHDGVFKARFVAKNNLLAVKSFPRPIGKRKRRDWREKAEREIKIHSDISHPHIVKYLDWKPYHDRIEIFTDLNHESLDSMMKRGVATRQIADKVLHHMLQALDYLESKKYIHRDVKPENILSKDIDGDLSFQLANFGLCSCTSEAMSYSGSLFYMAPEIVRNQKQSPKADVWSLMVTMLVIPNVQGMATKHINTRKELEQAISHAILDDEVSSLKEMAIHDPTKRASAAQMLVKLFNGEGLTTSASRVPPLRATTSDMIKSKPLLEFPVYKRIVESNSEASEVGASFDIRKREKIDCQAPQFFPRRLRRL